MEVCSPRLWQSTSTLHQLLGEHCLFHKSFAVAAGVVRCCVAVGLEPVAQMVFLSAKGIFFLMQVYDVACISLGPCGHEDRAHVLLVSQLSQVHIIIGCAKYSCDILYLA